MVFKRELVISEQAPAANSVMRQILMAHKMAGCIQVYTIKRWCYLYCSLPNNYMSSYCICTVMH